MQSTLEPGLDFAGRYRLVRLLGHGAAAQVHLAHDRELDREVALKVLTGSGVVASLDRFREEASALAELEHPNILQVYDFGEASGLPYLVLEHAPGGSLADPAFAAGLELPQAGLLAGGILEALEYAHSRGIVHRDIKPANVLLGNTGQPKLSDFGLAKSATSSVRTRTGLVVGTPEFMAPEIFDGVAASAASDLYSWGCLLHALLHGQPPYMGELPAIYKAAKRGRLPEKTRNGPAAMTLGVALAPDPKNRRDAAHIRRQLDRDLQAPQEAPTRMVKTGDIYVSTGPATQAVAETGVLGKQGARNRRRSQRQVRLALAAIAVVAIGAGLWSLRSSTTTATSPVPQADRLLREWTERLRDIRPAEQIRAIHRKVFSPPYEPEVLPSHYAFQMRKARLGDLPLRRARPLDEAREGLLYTRAWEQDRPHFAAALGAARLPYATRHQLVGLLQVLEPFDAYFRAWGRPPPYDVTPLMARAIPRGGRAIPPPPEDQAYDESGRKIHRHDAPWSQPVPPPVASDTPLDVGRHLVYHWRAPPREWPALLQDPDNLSDAQSAAFFTGTFGTAAIGSDIVDLADYVSASGEFSLTRPEETRVSLVIRAGNLLAPDAFAIRWNQDNLVRLRSLGVPTQRKMYEYIWPEHEYTVELPRETLRARGNEVEATLEVLPGLTPYQCADLFTIHVVVEERI